MKNLIIISAFLLVFFNGFSQKEIVSQNDGWAMYFGNHKLNKNWGIHTEYQWRRSDYFNSWQQSLMRLGIDYYAKNGMQITAGYGWIKSFPYGKQASLYAYNEHRIWQQLILKNSFPRLEVQHRYRLEQRFIEQKAVDLNGIYKHEQFNFRQRIRYRFLVNIPLTNKEMIDNTLFLSLYDELFVGFGKGIGKNIVDQNRLYGALGWRFNKNIHVQLGYLNQFIIKADGVKMERNHTIQAAITYNLDFSKVEK